MKKIKIIVRCCGERTEKRCIQLAKKQGDVFVVKAAPFGETMRRAYKLAIEFNQEWTAMVDADVLLHGGTLIKAIKNLKNSKKKNVFCLDGKTKDKTFMRTRRAGIHIYKTDLLPYAMKFIDDKKLKPESHVRKEMEKLGLKTVTGGGIVFGLHDYEQYYCDLWRKAFAQSRKLAGMVRRSPGIIKKWHMLSLRDADYRVIYEAHKLGRLYKGDIVIDVKKNYGASQGLRSLGIKEKGKLI